MHKKIFISIIVFLAVFTEVSLGQGMWGGSLQALKAENYTELRLFCSVTVSKSEFDEEEACSRVAAKIEEHGITPVRPNDGSTGDMLWVGGFVTDSIYHISVTYYRDVFTNTGESLHSERAIVWMDYAVGRPSIYSPAQDMVGYTHEFLEDYSKANKN